MAESSWPYPDPANSNKRIVTDIQFEQMYHPATPDGLLGTPSDSALVYGDDSGRQVKVRADRLAVLRGHGWASDTSGKTITIAANTSGSTRIDLIVLRLTRSTWQVTTEVRQGNPGSGAPSPVTDLGTTGVYEIALADVSVPSGDALIGAAQVTNRAWYVGSDGQMLCEDSATRPPHERSRTVWERSTARLLASDGTTWRIVSDDSGAVAATMSAGTAPWTASHNTLYRRNGWAFMQLTAKRAAAYMFAGNSYVVATVPSGSRPPFLIQSTATVPSRGALATVSVQTNGDVYVSPAVSDIPSNTSFVLSALSWPVA